MSDQLSLFLNDLKKSLTNPQRLMTGEADRWQYASDASYGMYLPDAVIQPDSAAEVSTIIKLANKWCIPVYPRGQSTSLSGGPLPVKGGLVLDCAQWQNKLEIDRDDMVAVVSPGVITAHIDAAANEYGLMYPPDPSSSHISTIGGNLAENAGGPRCVKYGVTKDYVLGLEIVTPEGDRIKTGGRTVKNVTGYDLTKLIVGSEGTLGIITEAVLRLIPKPPTTRTLLVVFDDLTKAGEGITKVMTSGVRPSKLELIDQACIRAVEAHEPMGLPTNADALLLVEVDGHLEAVEKEAGLIKKVLQNVGARSVEIAKNDLEAEAMWKARRLVSPAIACKKRTKFSEDATVPISKIPDMFKRLEKIREEHDLDLVVFGHAGDGNLHPNILANEHDKDEMKRVEEAIEEIFRAAVELGGTLSGEHGIGTMKSSFMELELGEMGVDMMKRIKRVWDPNNIMNPGKIFPESGQKFRLRQ